MAARPLAGIEVVIDDAHGIGDTIFDLESSVCRLFPLKSCGLTIRPRLKCGLSPHWVDGR
jgi:hypothetical protein